MQHIIISVLTIVGTCLVIALAAVALFVFRPKARRRRRHRRHSKRPRIDLFAPPRDPSAGTDA
jgi:amino acid transporter